MERVLRHPLAIGSKQGGLHDIDEALLLAQREEVVNPTVVLLELPTIERVVRAKMRSIIVMNNIMMDRGQRII